MVFHLISEQKLEIPQTICRVEFLQSIPNVQLSQKKYGFEINKMSNTFKSLAIEQVLLYLVRNVANPIFIRLREESLLAIWTPASISKFELNGQTRF